MKKAIHIILITAMLLICVTGVYAGTKTENDTIIKMTKEAYKLYLKDNKPLDRLYVKDEFIYLLAKPNEVRELRSSNFKFETQDVRSQAAFSTSGGINGAYHSYTETETVLQELADTYPGLCTLVSLGQSIEGREIYAIRITNLAVNTVKKQFHIMGCHHAREWISVEVPLQFAQWLLENHSSNPRVQTILSQAEINIIPIVNPDGLEFSIYTYRFWRKNRRLVERYVYGVDLNRNYGYKWGIDDFGSSPDPTSAVYRGASPFSEPETDAIRRFIEANPPAGAISYHNYSQIILQPWGYTSEAPYDVELLNYIAGEMAERIRQVSGRIYDWGDDEDFYSTNGDTEDWIYGTFRVPSYTIELPPSEFINGGFITPDEIIDSIAAEQRAALLYFIEYLMNKN